MKGERNIIYLIEITRNIHIGKTISLTMTYPEGN